jgi:dolichol-phosphate mannosyltransferase
MPKTVVVIPTYNEVENVCPIVEALWGLGIEGLSVLIVDDNIRRMARASSPPTAGHPDRLAVMRRPGKQGSVRRTRKLRKRSTWARTSSSRWADFSHSPSPSPDAGKTPGYDVVVGSLRAGSRQAMGYSYY